MPLVPPRAPAIRRAVYLTILGCLLAARPTAAAEAVLPGTAPLTINEPLDEVMVAGIDRYCLRAISAARDARKGIPPNRERFRDWIGAADSRLPALHPNRYRFELIASFDRSSMIARGKGYTVHAVRWPVLDGVTAEGLLLKPDQVRAAAVVIPDADSTPEMFAGLGTGASGQGPFVRRLAASGVVVVIPALISRRDDRSGHPSVAFTNQPHREFVYRQAFQLGRHVIGYEVQRVLAAVDLLEQFTRPVLPIGLAGVGEGGLLALYAAALDSRIRPVLVSGYYREREEVWREPLYRNVWGLLTEFGDAELAGLIAPRRLVIEASGGISVAGPLPARAGRRAAAAPGELTVSPPESVRAEFERGAAYYRKLGSGGEMQLHQERANTAIHPFASALGVSLAGDPGPVAPAYLPDADLREKRLFDELQTHVQSLLHSSHRVRDAKWRNADREKMRAHVHDELIGRLPTPTIAPSARSRLVLDKPGYIGYEVMLDVFDGVIASGILLLPRGLRPGEKRPVVVCQHGLEGTAMDTISRDARPYASYKAFSEELVRRGFIVYAPQNPYRGGDRFRSIQRKANPLKLSLFSFIVAQHEQTLRWLSTLAFVDPGRIGFYGLSYGGKTAMRVPPLVKGYALSICSGDFTEWNRSIAANDEKPGYIFTPEYETPEWNMGHTADHAELAMLIAPRPFLVEAGHRDAGQPTEWVMSQFGKVRRYYDQAGIGDRAELDLFDGPHTIHGDAAFRFLHRHLHWPEPRR